MAVNGVRFVQSAICPRYAATAHSINATFIFGQQAFGFTSLDGNVKMINNTVPQVVEALAA